jgi:2,3-dihydroxybenzoate-AMP ligase
MNTMGEPLSVGPKMCIPGVVYPPEEQLKKYVQAGYLGQQSLIDGYRETHARYPHRPALVGPEGNYTHGELDDITNRVASAFMDMGLKPLDRVVFQVANCNELIFGWLGCLKAGLIPVCTLVSHREREISYLAKHSQARMHFVHGDDPKFDHVNFAHKMRQEIPTLEHIVVARGPARDGALSLKDLYEAQDPVVAKQRVQSMVHDPFQVVLFHLSGGTTGVPKIIPRFGNEYLYMMRAIASFNGYDEHDTFYCPTPFMHNLNMGTCSGPTLLAGGAMAVAPTLDPEVVKTVLKKFKPTRMVMGGPTFAKMAPQLEKNRKANRVFNALPFLKHFFPSVAEKLIDFRQVRGVYAASSGRNIGRIMGVPTFHLFGMTEGVIMYTRSDDDAEVRVSAVGRPVSPMDRIKILRPGTEEELPVGEIGEPAFQGPYTTWGYYDAPERNKEAFTSDGFYRSGDLMSCRQINGKLYYFFEGRIKDVVDRGGEKINAGEVEEAVLTHPAIESCAIIGTKDKALGERMCACVVIRQGHSAPTVSELGSYLENYGLAKFKWPERIEVMSVLPTTHVGKLDKISLKQKYDALSSH